MSKFVIVRKDKEGNELMETPCPMTKFEAEQMLNMMNSAGDSYIYEMRQTNKKSPFKNNY